MNTSDEYRAEIARAALAAYDRWIEDGTRGRDRGDLSSVVRGDLATSARWLLEELEARPAAGPRATGQANTAIRHLDIRQAREVLAVLALRVPAAVLDAIAEAGHGHG